MKLDDIASWVRLGASRKLIGPSCGRKTNYTQVPKHQHKGFEASWAARSASLGVCGVSWVFLGPFGPPCKRLGDGLGILGLFEAILGRLGGVLGMGEASRKLIGPSALRASWGWVEGVWVAAWAALGASGASWVHSLAKNSMDLYALVACLRPSWRRQGPSWTRLWGRP